MWNDTQKIPITWNQTIELLQLFALHLNEDYTAKEDIWEKIRKYYEQKYPAQTKANGYDAAYFKESINSVLHDYHYYNTSLYKRIADEIDRLSLSRYHVPFIPDERCEPKRGRTNLNLPTLESCISSALKNDSVIVDAVVKGIESGKVSHSFKDLLSSYYQAHIARKTCHSSPMPSTLPVSLDVFDIRDYSLPPPRRSELNDTKKRLRQEILDEQLKDIDTAIESLKWKKQCLLQSTAETNSSFVD